MLEEILHTEALSIGYRLRRDARVVAAGLGLTLRRGELVCLLGPNGAGKSTLLRTLSGLQAPLAGRVVLEGCNVHRLTPMERARQMSVVLTDRVTAGMFTGYDLVGLGRQPHTDWRGRLTSRDHDIVRRALEAVGASALAGRLVAELSDGERQRVMVGRALAQEPRVMILDEITAFLDLPRRVEIMRLLADLAHDSGTSILVSTHDLDLALRTADQLWLAAGGGRIECGAPEDLVLAGAFEQTFMSEGVTFDPSAGAFRTRVATRGVVAIDGEGLPARWTARAVERAGYAVASNGAEASDRIEVTQLDGRVAWRLERPAGATIATSLGAVVNDLRGVSGP